MQHAKMTALHSREIHQRFMRHAFCGTMAIRGQEGQQTLVESVHSMILELWDDTINCYLDAALAVVLEAVGSHIILYSSSLTTIS